MEAVILESVCKSFGQVQAVNDLDVQIPTGSIYGFLGPNGAGKTTTIRMIMNIIRPDKGRIEIFGKDGRTDCKGRIGYMPEERGLYRKMTVKKVLSYFGAVKGVSGQEIGNRVNKWLERVELSEWANKRVEELSKGMQQKLQFAVTAINEPELLILDEPFAGLDPVNLDSMKEIILQMHNEGKTVIFSTHIMHEAEQLCDFIVLINRGKVVVDGRLDDIRTRQRTGAVSIELDGDTNFIDTLPMVAAVRQNGRRLDITLAGNADPQELLKALVSRARVLAFEVKVPSLHEIFVSLVGKDGAKDS
jgi:ABC-2 type transport system ATP-binding protein